MDELIRKIVSGEVSKQMAALDSHVADVKSQNASQSAGIAEVKAQNDLQSKSIASMFNRIDKLDHWRISFFGNGSGIPGAWEHARKEDREWRERVICMINEMKERDAKEDGKTELREEIEHNRIEIDKLAEVKKTSRLGRWEIWLKIASYGGGAWLLTLVRPFLKVLLEHLIRMMQ